MAYAAAAGTAAAPDGRGRNSPYTSALLAYLEEPLELSAVFRRVRARVLRTLASPPRHPTALDGWVADSRTAPAVGTVTADTPLSAIAAIDGAGRHDFRAGWRDDGRDTLSVPRPRPAGHRGSREPEHRRERGRPRGRGLGRRTR